MTIQSSIIQSNIFPTKLIASSSSTPIILFLTFGSLSPFFSYQSWAPPISLDVAGSFQWLSNAPWLPNSCIIPPPTTSNLHDFRISPSSTKALCHRSVNPLQQRYHETPSVFTVNLKLFFTRSIEVSCTLLALPIINKSPYPLPFHQSVSEALQED